MNSSAQRALMAGIALLFGVFLFAVSFLTLLGVFFLLFYVFCERFVFLGYGEECSYYGNSW